MKAFQVYNCGECPVEKCGASLPTVEEFKKGIMPLDCPLPDWNDADQLRAKLERAENNQKELARLLKVYAEDKDCYCIPGYPPCWSCESLQLIALVEGGRDASRY